jgi:hypothetical protein
VGKVPLEATIYDLARIWNRLPWEIKQLPASEIAEMIDHHNIETFTQGEK